MKNPDWIDAILARVAQHFEEIDLEGLQGPDALTAEEIERVRAFVYPRRAGLDATDDELREAFALLPESDRAAIKETLRRFSPGAAR